VTRGSMRVRRVARGALQTELGAAHGPKWVAGSYLQARGWRSSDGMRRHPCAWITRIEPLAAYPCPPLPSARVVGGALTCRP